MKQSLYQKMLHWHIYNSGGVVPQSQQLGWQAAAAVKSVNVTIIYMTTLKLANINCLLEVELTEHHSFYAGI